MASTIHPKYWTYQPPMPVRRVWVPKPGTTEKRPLAVLTIIDRCKQALVKLALEPEWEVKFEQHSYGFRPGRSPHDAIAALLVAIEGRPMFVFDADIAEAFDHVNQAAVLNKLQTSPVLRQVIEAWLRAGVLDGGTFYPSLEGIAQGGVLSPLLMNVALHGMEAAVTQGAANSYAREQPILIRYADDFVVLHPDFSELQQAVKRLKHWLATAGLQVNADKTRITHTLTPYQGQVGFDFLGFHIRQESVGKTPMGKGRQEYAPGLKTITTSLMRKIAPHEHGLRVKSIITPSQEAVKRHLAAIDQKLQHLQTAPQAQVIAELNPLITGWAAHYNGIVEASTLRQYDDLIEQRLINWASKRHPDKARDWLLARYWHHNENSRRIFATSEGVQLRTYRQTRILRG
jgi:RNA-directed DNA polymerase